VSKADEFRLHAQDCRDWAAKVPSDEQRAMWLELAERWEQLADTVAQAAESEPTA
jgi:hypothetical protein